MNFEKMYRIYVNAMSHAIIGINPGTDTIIKKNLLIIKQVTSILKLTEIVPDTEIFRGILLEDKYVHPIKEKMKVLPMPKVSYLSFSEDITVAEEFADKTAPISQFVAHMRPLSKGYIIKYIPTPQEVMFHYKWKIASIIQEVIHASGLKDCKEVMEHQKEVILFQYGHEFEINPYHKIQ